MTSATGSDAVHLFCERCGIRVKPGRTECPRCSGLLVRRNLLELQALERRVAQEQAISREMRRPALVLGAAFALTVAGVLWGLARGATQPLVSDVIEIGRRAPARATTVRPAAATSLEFDPGAVDAVRGDRAFAQGDLERAVANYRETLDRRPDDLNALNNAGQALVRLGRATEAVPLLQRAVASSPRSWMAQFNLGRALGEAGEWARAAEHYAAAAALMPSHYPTLFNLGCALERAGRDAAAADAFGRAAASDPGQADPWLQMGAALERLGRREQARQAFERFLEMAPGSPERPRVEQHVASLAGTAPPTGSTPPPR